MNQNFLLKEELSKVKLFIATPMYGGVCSHNYLTGITDLFALCTTYDIALNLHGTTSDSLEQRSKNACVDYFLKSDFTHLIFIDPDVKFTGKDVISLLSIMLLDKEKHSIVAFPYHPKNIYWGNDKSSERKELSDYACLENITQSIDVKDIKEMSKVGTRFTMIERSVFEEFIKNYPSQLYKTSLNEPSYVFFDPFIDPETRLYLTADHMFCNYVRKMGRKIWLAPWTKYLEEKEEKSFPDFVTQLRVFS